MQIYLLQATLHVNKIMYGTMHFSEIMPEFQVSKVKLKYWFNAIQTNREQPRRRRHCIADVSVVVQGSFRVKSTNRQKVEVSEFVYILTSE